MSDAREPVEGGGGARVVGNYELLDVIGRGATAEVWRASHRMLGTSHAIKVLHTASPHMRSRAIQEARIQANLRHPHVVRVSDVVELDGKLGLVAELVAGPTLSEWLLDDQPPLAARLAVYRQVVSAVGAAHQRGIIHRDLKPDNVLVDLTEGAPAARVTDFGLARILDGDSSQRTLETQQGTILGTPAFMAPEQLEDARAVDARADVFALGCILYAMVLSRLPFPTHDLRATAAAILGGRFVRPVVVWPDIPAGLADTIEACLEADPADRIPSCASLLDHLEAGLTGTGLEAGSAPQAVPATQVPSSEHPPDPPPERATGAGGGAADAQVLGAATTPVAPPSPATLVPTHSTVASRAAEGLHGAGPTLAPADGLVSGMESFLQAPSDARPREQPDASLELEADPPRRRSAWLVWGGIAVAAGLAAVVWQADRGPAPVQDAPPGVHAAPPEASIEAAAVVVPPAAEPPEAVPEPRPEAVPAARAQPRSSAPARSAPTTPPREEPPPEATPDELPPEEAPEPPPEAPPPPPPRATVSVVGAAAVELRDASGAYPAGRVAPGSYDVYVRFSAGGTWTHAGDVSVRAGQTVSLTCVEEMGRCGSR